MSREAVSDLNTAFYSNTFAATAFSSYGAFWLAYAFIVSPWSDIPGAYGAESEFASGVAFFLFGWFSEFQQLFCYNPSEALTSGNRSLHFHHVDRVAALVDRALVGLPLP